MFLLSFMCVFIVYFMYDFIIIIIQKKNLYTAVEMNISQKRKNVKN